MNNEFHIPESRAESILFAVGLVERKMRLRFALYFFSDYSTRLVLGHFCLMMNGAYPLFKKWPFFLLFVCLQSSYVALM